jgi:hypothetical protein
VTVSSLLSVDPPTRSPADQLLHTSHRYLLPVISGVCIALGGIVLYRGTGIPGLVDPLALLSLGAVTLASSLAYLRSRYPRTVTPGPGPDGGFVDSMQSQSAPISAVDPPTLQWEDLFYGRFETPARGSETATSLRVLFTPTSAAEQLWVHWLPTDVGQLPTELIGPIPESALLAPESEAVLLPPTSVGEVELLRELPELDRSQILDSPPQSTRPVWVGVPRPADRVPAVPDLRPSTGILSPGVDPPGGVEPRVTPQNDPTVPHWMRSILAEATNPVPPHLRSGTLASLSVRPDLPVGFCPDSVPGPTLP